MTNEEIQAVVNKARRIAERTQDNELNHTFRESVSSLGRNLFGSVGSVASLLRQETDNARELRAVTQEMNNTVKLLRKSYQLSREKQRYAELNTEA